MAMDGRRRTRAIRAVAVATWVVAVASCSGCRWIPARRAAPEAAPSEPRQGEPIAETLTRDVAPLPPLPPLRSIGDDEAFSAKTPILDAAAGRDAELRRAIAEEVAAPRPSADATSIVANSTPGSPAEFKTDVEIVKAVSDVIEAPASEPARLVARPREDPIQRGQSPRGDAMWDYVMTTLAEAASAERGDETPEVAPPVVATTSQTTTADPGLAIAEMRICKRVLGFGRTEPPADRSFRAGQTVLVYCEVEGLRDEEVTAGYRSLLDSSIAIRPASGGDPVWSRDMGVAEDVCRKRRRDFFVTYRLSLPPTLPPGDYDVVLVQKDILGGRQASRSAAIAVSP